MKLEVFEARFREGKREARTRVSFTGDLRGVGSWAQVMGPLIASGTQQASYYSFSVVYYYSLMWHEVYAVYSIPLFRCNLYFLFDNVNFTEALDQHLACKISNPFIVH